MSSTLEDRVRHLEGQVAYLNDQLASWGHPAPSRPPAHFAPHPPLQTHRPWEPEPVAPADEPPARRQFQPTEVQSGRLLALVGSIAVVLGIAFLVALAIERGWISQTARVVIAALASSALLAAGTWLFERKGRTQAALAMVATAIAGLYLTLTAATALYGLVPEAVGLPLAFAIGSVATVIAVRANSRTVAAIGIGGSLVAPLLGDALTAAGMGFLALVTAAAAAVLVWRRWPWLMVGASAVSLAQVALWAIGGPPAARLVIVLTAFAGLNLAVALGYDVRTSRSTPEPASMLLVPFGALVLGALGYFGLPHGEGQLAGGTWLVALAVGHALLAATALVRRWGSEDVALLMLGTAVLVGDVAFGLLAGGWVLAVGWAASATGFAVVAQRYTRRTEPLQLTVGGQLALAIGHVLLFEAPPSELVEGGSAGRGALAALAAIVIAAFSSARLVVAERRAIRATFDVLGMVALAYATAATLDGTALLVAWAAASLMLARAAAVLDDRVAKAGAFGFLTLLAGYVLVFQAPLASLVYGADDMVAAAFGLLLVAAVAAMHWRDVPSDPRTRTAVGAVAAVALLYLGSTAIVTAFQPGTSASLTGLDVGIRQQGQALLSAFWGLCGFAALWWGLRTRTPVVRLGGLAVLALAAGKVFLYDLSTLGSGYRIGSFIALGLLLLTAAFVYQRAVPRH